MATEPMRITDYHNPPEHTVIGNEYYCSRSGFIWRTTDACQKCGAKLAVRDSSQLDRLLDQIRSDDPKTRALARLVAADNCNYDRDVMRSEGLFEAAREALAQAEAVSVYDPDHLNPAKGGNRASDDYW